LSRCQIVNAAFVFLDVRVVIVEHSGVELVVFKRLVIYNGMNPVQRLLDS